MTWVDPTSSSYPWPIEQTSIDSHAEWRIYCGDCWKWVIIGTGRRSCPANKISPRSGNPYRAYGPHLRVRAVLVAAKRTYYITPADGTSHYTGNW